jgi:hypothetical protein
VNTFTALFALDIIEPIVNFCNILRAVKFSSESKLTMNEKVQSPNVVNEETIIEFHWQSNEIPKLHASGLLID